MTKILTGQKQISQFVGRRWDVILDWIKDEKFPEKKLSGIWHSDSELITKWLQSEIMSIPKDIQKNTQR